MLADRYDLSLSTASAAARDAFVQGCDLALTLYPGAVEMFLIAPSPRTRVLPWHKPARRGPGAGKATWRRRAWPWRRPEDMATGLPAGARPAPAVRFFDLVFAGQTDAAIAALARASGGMAARRTASRHCRQP